MQSLANLGLLCQVPHAYESLLKHRLHMESILKYSLCWVVALGLAGHPVDHWRGSGGAVPELTWAVNGKMPYWPGQSLGSFFFFSSCFSFLIPLNKEYCYYWKLSFKFFPVIFKVMVMFCFFPSSSFGWKLCPIFNIHLNAFSFWSYSCVISHRLLHTLLPQGLFFPLP